jgi:hypothetical protein
MEASELLKSAKLIQRNGRHLIDTQTVISLLDEFSKNPPKAGHIQYDLGWDDATGSAVDMMRMCFRHMTENNQFVSSDSDVADFYQKKADDWNLPRGKSSESSKASDERVNKDEFTKALETKLYPVFNCQSCNKPFVEHLGIAGTCGKLQEMLVSFREFANALQELHEKAEKILKASDEASETRSENDGR